MAALSNQTSYPPKVPADSDYLSGYDNTGAVRSFAMTNVAVAASARFVGTNVVRSESDGTTRPAGSTGPGVELVGNAGGSAYVQSWNATTNAFGALFFACSQWVLQCGGVTKLYHNSAVLESFDDLVVPDEAYGVSWNGSRAAPTKNAVYDKIESMGSSWTVLKLAADFTAPNSTTFTDISDGTTTLTFTPPADTDWELEGRILIWTTATANLPRVGVNCPANVNRGYGAINLWQPGASATTAVQANGGFSGNSGVTNVQMAAGGVLTASVPYLCEIIATGRSGSNPQPITIQLACETAAANTCFAKRGSFIKYRLV